MMRKILALILALVMVASMFAFVACNQKDPDTDPDPDENNPSTPGDDDNKDNDDNNDNNDKDPADDDKKDNDQKDDDKKDDDKKDDDQKDDDKKDDDKKDDDKKDDDKKDDQSDNPPFPGVVIDPDDGQKDDDKKDDDKKDDDKKDDDKKARVLVVSDGSVLDGWFIDTKVNSQGPILDATLTNDGTSWVKYIYSGVAGRNGGWQEGDNGVKILYRAEATDVKTWDVSKLSHLSFDLYVSDASVLQGVKFYLELTSAGTMDKEEDFVRCEFGKYVKGGLVSGVNHVEIPLSDMGGDLNLGRLDPTRWNFMRIYNEDSFDRGENFVMAFANFGFATYDPSVEINQPEKPVKPVDPVNPVNPEPDDDGYLPDVKPSTVDASNYEDYMKSIGVDPAQKSFEIPSEGVTTPFDKFN